MFSAIIFLLVKLLHEFGNQVINTIIHNLAGMLFYPFKILSRNPPGI